MVERSKPKKIKVGPLFLNSNAIFFLLILSGMFCVFKKVLGNSYLLIISL